MKVAYVSLICAVVLFSGKAVRAEYNPEPRFGSESAYTVWEISEEEYNADISGNVYKSYQRSDDGGLVPQYFQYGINEDKTYNETISNTGTGSGNGEEAYVEGGVGLSNSGENSGIDNVLFKDNRYQFDFTGEDVDVYVQGGAVYNDGVIGDKDESGQITGVAINADFIDNSVETQIETPGLLRAQGGALANAGEIGHIKGDFVQNSAVGRYAWGGAVYNEKGGVIHGMEGDFVGNFVKGESIGGGALVNEGQLGALNGDFVANHVDSSNYSAGGVLHNNDGGEINSISGNFVDNSSNGAVQAFGGAIDNLAATIGDIQGDFVNNAAISSESGRSSGAFGGAISNQGDTGNITGSFLGNQVSGQVYAQGGAIYNVDGAMGDLHADFIGNTAESHLTGAQGGAIYNEDGKIGEISGTFADNAAKGNSGAFGGAVYSINNTGSQLSGLRFVNASFYNNSANAANGEAKGGAIYGDDITIAADGGNSVFRGNTANGASNAVYMAGKSDTDRAQLVLDARHGGQVLFDDVIDGENYDIRITGDGRGDVLFNTYVNNVSDFVTAGETSFHLGTSGQINTQDYIVDNSSGRPVMTLDVEIDKENNGINNGVVNVSGDVSGTTNVVVNSLNQDKLENLADVNTIFVKAPNDDLNTESSFEVSRVIGSPYMWDSIRNYGGETDGSTWYLAAREDGEGGHVYAPEIPAYVGMQAAAVEQNRGINRSVAAGLRANRDKGCCDRQFKQKHNLWVSADYNGAEIDAPAEMDADVKGITAGIDVLSDGYQKLGVFGTYRQGDYDFSGKGKYASDGGADVETDSYIGGVYYNYDKYHWSVLTTLFGGKQNLDMRTDDDITFASTDGMQYGASLDVGRKFYLPHAWIVEPSLGLYYTMLDLDEFTDNRGKKVDFDVMHYMEAELGLRVEHLFCMNGWTAKVYAKPSVIQTFASGDSVNITGMDSVSTYDSQTLGRMEIGAKFGIASSLSAYVSGNYTFGSDYSGYGVDAGLNYAW